MLSLIFSCVYGQNVKLPRIEFEIENENDNYFIIPSGRDGVLIFYQSEESAKRGEKNWIFLKYDTLLNKIDTKELSVLKRLGYVRHYSDGPIIHLLLGNSFQNSSGSVNRIDGDFQVVKINIQDMEIKTVSNKIPIPGYINDLKVSGKNAFIMGGSLPTSGQLISQTLFSLTLIPLFTGATVYKFNPLIFNYDLKNNQNQLIQSIYPGNSFLVSSNLNKANKSLYTIIRNIPSRKEYILYLNEYNFDGKLQKSTTIKSAEDKDLVSGKIMNSLNNIQILIGTYSMIGKKRNKPVYYLTGGNVSTEGMYFSQFVNNKQTYIKFYPFSRFSNFLGTVNTSKLANPDNKGKNKKEVVLSYNLLMHDIIQEGDHYIMLAEAYYPKYHTEYHWVYGANGSSRMETESVFDGYKYTHALVAGFDKNGDMLWDHNFPIMEILTYTLKERVKVSVDNDKIIMVYSYNGLVKSKIINGSTIVEDKESTKIETGKEGDKVKEDYNEDMEFWYDNYFISYGNQKIKNKEKDKETGKRKRTVFYLNKIEF